LIALHLLVALVLISIEFTYGMKPSDLYSRDIYYSIYVLFSLALLSLSFYSLFKKHFFVIYKKTFFGYLIFILPVMYELIIVDKEYLEGLVVFFLTPIPLMLVESLTRKK
jgi:hypothetical protein